MTFLYNSVCRSFNQSHHSIWSTNHVNPPIKRPKTKRPTADKKTKGKNQPLNNCNARANKHTVGPVCPVRITLCDTRVLAVDRMTPASQRKGRLQPTQKRKHLEQSTDTINSVETKLQQQYKKLTFPEGRLHQSPEEGRSVPGR